MQKVRPKRLPRFRSIGKLVKFFESNDLGSYWDQMPRASFEVDIKRKRHVFSLDPKLAKGLTRLAQSKRTSSQRLINTWLREKLLAETHPAG